MGTIFFRQVYPLVRVDWGPKSLAPTRQAVQCVGVRLLPDGIAILHMLITIEWLGSEATSLILNFS